MASPVSNFHLAEQIFKMTGQSYSEALPVNPVFVCIDCEAFELEQNKVTEVGVAVLDTRLLREVEPGENGKNWIAKMTYAHFRPVEYAYNVNRRFVHGAEDQFAFGNTTWIKLKDATAVIERIFKCPERLSEAVNLGTPLRDGKRDVVFVAHGLSNDDEYLAKLGSNLSRVRNITRKIDSQRVAGSTKKKSIGLRRLLDKLGVRHQGLHNGGNDAAYTLQALVYMAVKEVQQPGLIYGSDALPPVTLPGSVRKPGQSAPHVYGGTARADAIALPIDGGKKRKDKPFKNAFKNMKRLRPDTTTSTSLSSEQLHTSKKRPAPLDDQPEEQPARKTQRT